MLDPQYIRDNLDAVKANCKDRNVTADVDRVVALDDERKRLLSTIKAPKEWLMMSRQTRAAFDMIWWEGFA